nr:hypothetical protein [Armatimonadota bacterium]
MGAKEKPGSQQIDQAPLNPTTSVGSLLPLILEACKEAEKGERAWRVESDGSSPWVHVRPIGATLPEQGWKLHV